MDYATPRQVLHAAKMMVDTKVSEESAKFLEESGLLTDLFKSGLTRNGPVHIARNTFRRFLGMEPEPNAILTLAHARTTNELLEHIPHDDLLSDKNFPYRGRDLVVCERVSFPWTVSYSQAVELASLWGLTQLEYEDAFVWASISYHLPMDREGRTVFSHKPVWVNGAHMLVAFYDGKLQPLWQSDYEKLDRSWEFAFAQERRPIEGYR